jgi:hypothetical protein
MNELCTAIGLPKSKSHKVAWIVRKLHKAGIWCWPTGADRVEGEKRLLKKIASRHGENV